MGGYGFDSALSDVSVTCRKDQVLEILSKNLAEHLDIVKEAREGYVTAATEALTKKLEQIKEGKIVGLQFTLAPPQDHSKEYATAIKMLEMHQDPTITLGSKSIRTLIENNWEWTDQFLMSNSAYSAKARMSLGG